MVKRGDSGRAAAPEEIGRADAEDAREVSSAGNPGRGPKSDAAQDRAADERESGADPDAVSETGREERPQTGAEEGAEVDVQPLAGRDVVPIEQYQRLLAEFDNYRKRVERERERSAQWTRAELLGNLLVILDDMDRARTSVSDAEKAFDKEGILIIMDRFAELLKREGLEEVPASPGDVFDPEMHEAVLMVPSAEVPEGSIAQVLEKGYRVADRLLRPAKVAVARASET